MRVFLRDKFFDIAPMAALFVLISAMAQAQVHTPPALQMPQSHNPLSPYMAEQVAEPVLTNSPRLY
jgi:hypothetical protein